jgi:hypothetical protein
LVLPLGLPLGLPVFVGSFGVFEASATASMEALMPDSPRSCSFCLLCWFLKEALRGRWR